MCKRRGFREAGINGRLRALRRQRVKGGTGSSSEVEGRVAGPLCSMPTSSVEPD